MVVIGFVVALVLYLGIQFVGLLLTAFYVRRYGVLCEEISLGFGPSIASVKFFSIPIRIKLFPYGGSVRFPGAESRLLETQESKEFSSLPAFSRVLVAILNPLVLLIAGVVLIQVAMLLPDSNLVIANSDPLVQRKAISIVDYPAVPSLSTTGTSLTWRTAVELFYDTIVEFWIRFFTFGSLEEWSGAFGWMVMAGDLLWSHPGAFISTLGMICLSGFLLNMAPVPPCSGGMAILNLIDCFGFSASQSSKTILSGIAITVVIGLCMLFLDFRWFHVIFGLQ